MEEENSVIGTDSFEDIEVLPGAAEYNFDAEIQEETEKAAAQQALEQDSPNTAAAATSPQPTAQPAGGQKPEETPEEVPFDQTKDFSYYKAQGMSRKEWTRRRMQNPARSELENFATDPRDSFEMATAPFVGPLDFGVELINMIPGVSIPKIPEYENEQAQGIRDLSSIVVPTLTGGNWLKGLGAAAHGRVGWGIGNSPFLASFSKMGLDALTSMGVGSVSSQYTDHNALGAIKKNFPAFGDYIPDSLATLDTDSQDEKRAKNIKEDVMGGALIDVIQPAYRLAKGLFAGRQVASAPGVQRVVPQLVGENPEAIKFIDSNKPPTYQTPEEEFVGNILRREDNLDELGAYNLTLNPKMDLPLKGVHDMFDEAELAMRSVDDYGIAIAGIDAARISKNLDTVEGRIANFVSEPALQYSLSDADAMADVSLGLARQLQEAGEIGQIGKDWKVTYKDQVDATMDIAVDLFDPRMSKADLAAIIEPYRYVDEATGKTLIGEEGFGMITKAMKGFGDEITALNYTRAQALTAGSMAGRIADVAEGMRLADGTVSVEAAQDKIVDLMKYLYRTNGEAKYYLSRKTNLLDQMQNGFKDLKAYNASTIESGSEIAKKLYQEAEYFGESIKGLANTNPEMMRNLLKAYEMSGGKISTINELNKWVANKTGVFGKAFVDMNPDEQSMFMAGLWNNIYNSVLSGPTTAVAAGAGNVGGLISKPTTHFAGALVGKDWKALQRNWIAYSSVAESVSRAMPYAGDVFRKASQNASAVSSATRRDLIIKNEKDLTFLRELADSKAAEGDDGLLHLVQTMENMHAMSKDPILRWGVNMMTGLDAFTGSMMGSAEARFRVIDKLAEAGQPITKEAVAALEGAEYAKMFGKDGLLKDEAVKWTTGELALNLNSPLANGVTELTKYIPATKPFLMFPTTIANGVSLVGKYTPFALFSNDYRLLSFASTEQLLSNTQFIDEFLTTRGMDISKMSRLAKENKIIDIKYEVQGRIGLGTTITSGLVSLMFADRITGANGLRDPAKQKARTDNTDWEARMITLPDGSRISYAGLGPISDMVGLTVDIMDNWDVLGDDNVMELLGLTATTIAAGLYDQGGLSTVKPFLDMASGERDPQRWAAGFANSVGPLSGMRNNWSKMFTRGVKMAEKEFAEALRRQNSFLDGIDPSANDTYIYNPITGKKKNDWAFVQRLWNASNTFKVVGAMSPEEQYVNKVGFNTSVQFKTYQGTPVPTKVQSELMKIVGEDQIFTKAIKQEMRIRSQEDVQAIIDAAGGEVDEELFLDSHTRLRKAIKVAKEAAYMKLPPQMKQELLVLQAQQKLEVTAASQGTEVRDLVNMRK